MPFHPLCTDGFEKKCQKGRTMLNAALLLPLHGSDGMPRGTGPVQTQSSQSDTTRRKPRHGTGVEKRAPVRLEPRTSPSLSREREGGRQLMRACPVVSVWRPGRAHAVGVRLPPPRTATTPRGMQRSAATTPGPKKTCSAAAAAPNHRRGPGIDGSAPHRCRRHDT